MSEVFNVVNLKNNNGQNAAVGLCYKSLFFVFKQHYLYPYTKRREMSTQTGCLRLCYVFLQVLLSVLRALRSFSALWRHFINYDFISVHFSHSNLVILVNFTVPNLHTHTHTTKNKEISGSWSNLLVVVVKMTMTPHLFVLLRVFVFNSQFAVPKVR